MQTKQETTPAKSVPKWLETPPDHAYSLDMYENGDHSIDGVEMTRDEYIALKTHLAKMRSGEGEAVSSADRAPVDDNLAPLLERVSKLDEHGREKIRGAIIAIERNGGCWTPGEEFVCQLLWRTTFSEENPGLGFSPDSVEEYWETFKRDFNDMAVAAPGFCKRNAKYLEQAALAETRGIEISTAA